MLRCPFGAVEHVSAYSVYGNIDSEGTLLIETPDGHAEIFDQTYDRYVPLEKVTTDHPDQVMPPGSGMPRSSTG
ncbi:MAG: hypothetical protein R2881_09280 [Eubacteriales bacterium]